MISVSSAADAKMSAGKAAYEAPELKIAEGGMYQAAVRAMLYSSLQQLLGTESPSDWTGTK